ncbi:serine-rich adhesin for platelets-like isoform X2 [Montipora foliosa]|uniref:serine-rich adhesin for platelets-like isoform X2 n=1 Tax=Montipora foliosa TaxID=591990 RepID=UPI0035F1DBFF
MYATHKFSSVGDRLKVWSIWLHSSKPPPPPPTQKIRKVDSLDEEVEEDAFPTFGVSSRTKEQRNEPQGLGFRKLGENINLDHDSRSVVHANVVEDQKSSFAYSGETLLATFYAMLYTNVSTEKEWKLEVDGFIPVCFVQGHENPNKPFKIIAVENSRRIMEYLVMGNTTCTRNSTFVRWQDGSSIFGVRFSKDDQAEQFFNTVKRMASTLAKAAQLMKQQLERKAVIKQMSDPTSSSDIHHTKVSLIIKLPDKQTTIMSVPGLLTMSELFDLICKKENLDTAKHQLSVPRTGGRKVTFDSGTAVGLLKIREISIIRIGLSDNRRGSSELESDSLDDLLDFDGEESKRLEILLPTGTQKSYRVSLHMTMKQLVMRVCTRERLNPRHHSLQYIDFKHEFLSMASTVSELEVNQIRLMDKRGRNISRSSITDDDSPSNSPDNIKFRRSSGVDSESDSSSTISGEDKENGFTWKRSKSLDALVDNGGGDVFMEQDGPAPGTENLQSPADRNSSGGLAAKKPPTFPKPYVAKSSTLPKKPPIELHNGSLNDQSFSPIKKDGIYASTPELSFSTKSEISPGTSNIKTSTPDNKVKRRAAPPPPPRPAFPKALFAESKTDSQAVVSGVAPKKPSPAIGANSLGLVIPATTNDAQAKSSQKKRPAPPRPTRPAPPKPPLKGSTDSGDSKCEGSVYSTDRTKEIKASLKKRSFSLDLGVQRGNDQDEQDGNIDWRGVSPIFIPPPPPDEMPPPLDECDTPVEPLTEFEAGFLEGDAQVNGFVDFDKYLIPSPRQISGKEEMQIEPSDRMSVLGTVHEHASFPVVPPPPLYSECSSNETISQEEHVTTSIKKDLHEDIKPGLNSMPASLIETVATKTSQNSGNTKDHDSGFDQSSEGLTRTPQGDQLQNDSIQSWDDPDSGSSLDGISAIPPPLDFASTRPITPPCQFANPTVESLDGFDREQETEQAKPPKKLNPSENSIPWLKQGQAPLNTTLRLQTLSQEADSDLGMIISKDKIKLGDLGNDTSFTRGYIPEAKPESVVQSRKQTEVNVVVSDISGCELSSGLSGEENKEPINAEPILDLTDTDVGKGSIKREEQMQIIWPLNPEPKAKAVEIVRETEVQIAHDAINSYTKQEQQSETFEPGAKKIKSELTEGQPRAVEIESQESVIEPQAVQLKQNLQSEKPEIRPKPIRVRKEPSIDKEQSKLLVKPIEKIKAENPESTISTVTVVRGRKFENEAHLTSSGTEPTEGIRPGKQVIPGKPEPHRKDEQPETRTNPVTSVRRSKVDVPQSVPSRLHTPLEGTKGMRENEPVKPVFQAKPGNQRSLDVEESPIAQLQQEEQESSQVLNYLKSESFKDTSENNVKVREEGVVVEALVTPEVKPMRSSHDRLRDLEGMFQELDKEALPTPGDTNKRPEAYEELPVQTNSTKKVIRVQTTKAQESLEVNSEEGSMKDVTNDVRQEWESVLAAEPQVSRPESYAVRIDVDSDLRLDLSSVEQVHVQPRPPSSSPPTTTPRSSTLPSPTELYSDRSTESGISLSEESKISGDFSVPVGDKETVAFQTCSTQTELQGDGSVNDTSGGGEPQAQTKLVKVSSELQTPMTMPSGMALNCTSETFPETRQSVRDSNLSDYTDESSSSLPSSPVETVSTVEPIQLPKPPPLTVPPLRRYSDLASDLNFISSAAKAADRVHQPETKPEAPPRPGDSLLKRSGVSTEERSGGWVGPKMNTNNPKRSIMWTTAFKPVSFDEQANKVARPVSFNVTSTVGASVSPSTNATGVGVSKSSYTIERRSPDESSENISLEQENAPKKSPDVKESFSYQIALTDPNNNSLLKKTEPCPSKSENVHLMNSSESQISSSDNLLKKDENSPGSQSRFANVQSSASIRDQIMRASVGGNRAQRRPLSAVVDSSKFQILTTGPKPLIKTGGSWADVKKRAAIQASDVERTGNTSRKHTSREEDKPRNPDLPHSTAKPLQLIISVDTKQGEPKGINSKTHEMPVSPAKEVSVKLQAARPSETKSKSFLPAANKPLTFRSTTENEQDQKEADPLPTVTLRTKTAKEDPSKRHSLPAYIIQGSDGKQPPKTSTAAAQFHFIVKEVKTDTSVVPQGMVAALKALREKK